MLGVLGAAYVTAAEPAAAQVELRQPWQLSQASVWWAWCSKWGVLRCCLPQLLGLQQCNRGYLALPASQRVVQAVPQKRSLAGVAVCALAAQHGSNASPESLLHDSGGLCKRHGCWAYG